MIPLKSMTSSSRLPTMVNVVNPASGQRTLFAPLKHPGVTTSKIAPLRKRSVLCQGRVVRLDRRRK
jgi:hypothetical protein